MNGQSRRCEIRGRKQSLGIERIGKCTVPYYKHSYTCTVPWSTDNSAVLPQCDGLSISNMVLSLPPSLPLPLFLWPLLSFLSLSGTIDVPAQILRVLTPPPKHHRHGVPARLAHDALRAVPERVTLKFSVKMSGLSVTCHFSV